jgi:hypothetical protein
MKVELTTPLGTFAEGILDGVLSQRGPPYPHIVIEMKVAGSNHPAKVTLDALDLSTIARLARGSTIQQIQDAIK